MPSASAASVELGVFHEDEAKSSSSRRNKSIVATPPIKTQTVRPGPQEEPRRVHIWNGVCQPIVVNGKPMTHVSNKIKTSKYTW